MLLLKYQAVYQIFNIPETLEDEDELNMDAAIWQDASHERGGDWMGHPITPTACTPMETPRYLTGDLTGFNWLLQPLHTCRKKREYCTCRKG